MVQKHHRVVAKCHSPQHVIICTDTRALRTQEVLAERDGQRAAVFCAQPANCCLTELLQLYHCWVGSVGQNGSSRAMTVGLGPTNFSLMLRGMGMRKIVGLNAVVVGMYLHERSQRYAAGTVPQIYTGCALQYKGSEVVPDIDRT